MGLRRALKIVGDLDLEDVSPTSLTRRPAPAIASPWAAGQLESIVWADIYGTDAECLPLTRAAPMRVPAVARARTLITSTLSGCPLVALRGEEVVDPQPTWLYRTDGPVPPQARILWTIDDVLFGGWCLWAVERDVDGHVIDALRVPPPCGSSTQTASSAVGGIVPDPDSVGSSAGRTRES